MTGIKRPWSCTFFELAEKTFRSFSECSVGLLVLVVLFSLFTGEGNGKTQLLQGCIGLAVVVPILWGVFFLLSRMGEKKYRASSHKEMEEILKRMREERK